MKGLAIITIACCARVASAEPAGSPTPGAGQPTTTPSATATARTSETSIGHVITAPTAWLPLPGQVVASGGIDHKGAANLGIAFGLGGIASIELGGDTDVRACHGCAADATPSPVWLGRATFKLGAPEDTWFQFQPAVAFGVRATFTGKHAARVGEAFVVASRTVGPVRLHGGAAMTDATDNLSPDDERLEAAVRPLGGLEWTPSQYPRTTVMGDVTWLPLLADPLTREWVAGWGVRYQAFTWGSIELGGRNRQAEGIGDTRFFLRMNLAPR